MFSYVFFTRDYFTNSGNYCLSGEHYKTLLQHCFRYSSYVAFSAKDTGSPCLQQIEKWRVDDHNGITCAACTDEPMHFFIACEAVYRAMLTWTDDLFELYTLQDHRYPEDPIFYREDGTVFLDTIIHEGECYIYPRDGEDISDILRFGHWLRMNENWCPDVPAADHQFPLPDPQEIKNDQLFKDLIAIWQSPNEYINCCTVEEVDKYVRAYRPYFLRKEKIKTNPVFSCIPRWYSAFEFFVLGRCCASTCTSVPKALVDAGYEGKEGFAKYYQLLREYVKTSEDFFSKNRTGDEPLS